MKLDYKSVKKYFGNGYNLRRNQYTSLSRDKIRAILGLVAIVCLSLAFCPKSSIDENGNSSDRESNRIENNQKFEVAQLEHIAELEKEKVQQQTNSASMVASTIIKSAALLSNTTKTDKTNSTDKIDQKIDSKTNSKTEKKISSLAAEKNENSKGENNKVAEESTSFSFRTVTIQKKDTLAKIFNRFGISAKDLKEIMSSEKAKEHLASLQPGQTLKLQINKANKIDELSLNLEPGSTLIVSRKDSGFEIEHKQLPYEKKLAFGKGEIHASLISAAKKAGLDNKIVAQMVEIFGGNIDFSQDLQPNDTFRVLFEQKCLEDSPIQTGPILAAELVYGGGKSSGKKIQAVRYTDKSGQTGYFSPEGYGLTQAFLRSPVNFASISSGFGMRKHPVLHRLRAHKGVDFAAPRGTPVQATADAKVIFVGNKGGYGKVVELQHGPRYSTLYAHLSKFAKDIRVGKPIKQGQVIGYVGRTGLATGDHLHYEFRIDGVHRNPMTVALPKSKLIPDSNKRHFIAHAKEMLRLLDLHENKINVASAEIKINE